ncbi:DUF3991 and toprim domain-containing protein [Christensenellaceae bacterium OttesenSCG-928-K19]|nr:DUF3991 and toprim domain-containing protein [Christensenellaceae bacterium OttesenSCG-928-K19]
MSWVEKEQIEAAREIDLLSYLQAKEPEELKRTGPNEYRTVTHGSVVITNNKWYWNRGKFGGVSALDYLVQVCGVGLVEAVEALTGERAAEFRSCQEAAKQQPPPKKWTFYPPKPLRYSNGAVSYLQGRGISPEVIGRCMQLGILFESRYYNPNSKYHNAAVCVFAGKDESGRMKFAAMRGIDSEMKQDKAGSDKRFNFHLPARTPRSRHLAVFEAPIDALSHATLQQRDGWEWDGHRLSLGGTADVALVAFLERNPQITRVILHLDNDAAGIIGARQIKAMLRKDARFSRIRVSVNPPRKGKDYNQALQNIIKREEEQSRPVSRRADISL